MTVLPTKTSLISIDAILGQADLIEGDLTADFGCGRSIFFLYSLSTLVGKSGHVYGIDILPDIIESAQRDISHHKLESISIIQGDLENADSLAIPSNSLKAVFLINTLSQAANTKAMLTVAKDLLATNGKIIVVDWKPTSSPLGPVLSQRLKDTDIIETLELTGLKMLDQFDAGPYHYGISAQNLNS